MPRSPSVILFDLDGVLVDSRDAIARSINHALEAHGVAPRPEEELHARIGAPLPSVFVDLLTAAGRDPSHAASCVRSYRERYGPASLEETRVFEGVPAVLERLGQGHRLAVATTKPAEYARPILEALALIGHFETVVGTPLHATRSEGKDVTIRRALDALGVPPPAADTASEGTMVGDRHFDVRGARANGLYAVGVTWGAGSVAELVAAGADAIVDRPADLLEHLTRR